MFEFRMTSMRYAGLVGLFTTLLATSAWSLTLRVPETVPTIAAALAAAQAGDTVQVACGTYFEAGLSMKSGVILRSETGLADCVTVDAMGTDRVLNCVEVDASTRIEGMTFTHGASYLIAEGVFADGGGIYCRRARLWFVRCDVVDNLAADGGGVFCDSSTVVMADCRISGNHAIGQFGSGGDGGGLVIGYGSADTLRGCTIGGNESNSYGGGVYCYGSPLISGCRIIDNLTDSRGGGIYCGDGDGTDAHIEDTWITGNAGGDGGGAHIRGTTTLARCLVAENMANWGYGYGGGISCRYHTGSIEDCTIVANEAVDAGGIAFYGDGPLVSNCLIAAGKDGGALGWGYAGPNSVPVIACCDLWGNQGGFGDTIPPEMVDGGGNISADPRFCGSTVPELPYALTESSPCAGGNNPDCGQVGAFGAMCAGATGVPPMSAGGSTLRLLGAYPNPLNPRTTIRFEMTAGGPVDLRIFDLGGRLVRTLLAGVVLEPGDHDAVWNGRDETGKEVAAGVYVYRLESGDSRETGRMALVR